MTETTGAIVPGGQPVWMPRPDLRNVFETVRQTVRAYACDRCGQPLGEHKLVERTFGTGLLKTVCPGRRS